MKKKLSIFVVCCCAALLLTTLVPAQRLRLDRDSKADPIAPPVVVTGGNVFVAPGSDITVPISVSDLTGMGTYAFQFHIHFDPNIVRLMGSNFGCSTVGTILPPGTGPVCNESPAGTLQVSVFGSQDIVGSGTLLNINFTALTTATAGAVSPLTFTDVEFYDSLGVPYPTVLNPGTITITGPTAAGVTLRGHVLNALGYAIPNARVIVIDEANQVFVARTNTFGNFSIQGLPAGQNYIVSAIARNHSFAAQSITLNNQITQVSIIAEQ